MPETNALTGYIFWERLNAAQFSLQYDIACEFIKRRFGLAELELYRDPDVLALADRANYRVDPNTGHPDHWSGEMIFNFKNGTKLVFRDEDTPGSTHKPLKEDQIVAKFMGNAQMAISQERAAAIRDEILALHKNEAPRKWRESCPRCSAEF